MMYIWGGNYARKSTLNEVNYIISLYITQLRSLESDVFFV